MADSIHIKLPDGSSKEVPKGTTALEVAKSISPRLRRRMPRSWATSGGKHRSAAVPTSAK